MKKILLIILSGFLFYNTCNAESVTKYYKTTYQPDGNALTTEVTEMEYTRESTINPLSIQTETEYKKLNIQTAGQNIVFTTEWKKTPKIKSYDVIALRGENVTLSTHFNGSQNALKDGKITTLNYNNYNSGAKSFANAFGISVDLIDNASNYKITVSVPYSSVKNNARVYASYQHATRNVTLAQSQNYTINANGYGRVILFNSPVNNYYDNTPGVDMTL